MKKIIFVLLAFVSLSAGAEIIAMDAKNSKNELFIDEAGLYRYKRAEEMYQNECRDIFSEEVRKKCLAAEKAVWEKNRTKEEVQKQGTLYTGKILIHSGKNRDAYFYVRDGKLGEKIDLIRDQYYFENGLLYDIKTEEPFTGDIVIGGVEGWAAKGEKAPRFVIQQNYEEGRPVGDPVVVSVK